MNVQDIIKEWLKAHGYDGLCHEECGCQITVLMPCGCTPYACVPGKKRLMEDGDWEIVSGEERNDSEIFTNEQR